MLKFKKGVICKSRDAEHSENAKSGESGVQEIYQRQQQPPPNAHQVIPSSTCMKPKANQGEPTYQARSTRKFLSESSLSRREGSTIFTVLKEKKKEKPSIWNSMSNKIILQKRRGNEDFVRKTKTEGICCQHKPHKRSTDGKHAINYAQQHLSLGNYKLETRRSDYNPIRMAQIETIDSINCWDMGRPELSFIAGGKANWYGQF